MSKIRLHGSSSGYTEIAPVAASGNNTLTLPNDGTIISKDAAGAVGVTSVHTTNITATGIATITTAKIGAGVTISESGIEASGIGITCANINGGSIGGRRNISINGACEVAQRGTSSTTYGYGSVDRFATYYYGHNEVPTHSQADVASGTSPYAEGFRKCLKVTNGNQTSGAGAAQFMQIQHKYESQDIAKSGWNYTSTSSYITVQFWVKASVAQTYYVYLRSTDGTGQRYYFPYALSANTWTKVVKTIPGNSNLQFDNDVNHGFQINFGMWYGTDYTASGLSAETWAAYASGTRIPDMTSTWWTTDDATFEITGVQLEVGPQATAFEHRSYADEFLSCCRYYFFTNAQHFFQARGNNSDGLVGFVETQVPLRASPSVTLTGGLRHWGIDSNSSSTTTPTIPSFRTNQKGVRVNQTGHSGVNDDCVMTVQTDGSDGQGLAFDSEL